LRYFTNVFPFVRKASGVILPAHGLNAAQNIVSSPVDADTAWTASGGGISVATTTTSTDLPLEGIYNSAIKITPISGSDYAYVRFTLPNAFIAQTCMIYWTQKTLAGYTNGDLKVDLYTNTASNYSGSYTRVALSTDISSITDIAAGSNYFNATFTPPSDVYYELRIVRVSGTSALNIVDVGCKPASSLGTPAQATATTLGAVKGGTVPGIDTGSSVAAGYIGEIISSGAMTTTPVASSTLVDVTGASLTLTKGLWLIKAALTVEIETSGTGAGWFGIFNSSNTFIGGNGAVRMRDPYYISKHIECYVNISSSTTYKLRCNSTGSTVYFRATGDDQSLPHDSDSYFYAIRIG
jgi:hypothetical protein